MQGSIEEKRRLVISLLTQSHGGLSYSQLNGKCIFFINIFSEKISGKLKNLFFPADFIEHVGRPIAENDRTAKLELSRMANVVKFGEKYLTNSDRSAHVCRRQTITPSYER